MSQGWRSYGAKTWPAFDGGAESGAVAPLAQGESLNAIGRALGRIPKMVRYVVAGAGAFPRYPVAARARP